MASETQKELMWISDSGPQLPVTWLKPPFLTHKQTTMYTKTHEHAKQAGPALETLQFDGGTVSAGKLIRFVPSMVVHLCRSVNTHTVHIKLCKWLPAPPFWEWLPSCWILFRPSSFPCSAARLMTVAMPASKAKIKTVRHKSKLHGVLETATWTSKPIALLCTERQIFF